jgi:putative addiction module killer protein
MAPWVTHPTLGGRVRLPGHWYPYGYSSGRFTVRQTQEFRDWLDGLKDLKGQLRIVARLRLDETGNLGDWAPVGNEVSEMRIAFGPGCRLYFTKRQNTLIVMLAGGDRSAQARDIKRAQTILQRLEFEEGERPRPKRSCFRSIRPAA